MSRAIRRYGRTLAFASTNRIDEAVQQQRKFLAAVKEVPETSFLFQNASLQILGVAEAMVAGEVEFRKGNTKKRLNMVKRLFLPRFSP